MFDGVPEQFHQFIASSRASPSPLPLPLPPLSHHSTFPPFHGFDPFPNPNPSPNPPPTTAAHQHHFLHHPSSILLHHKDVQVEEEEKDRSSLLAMSMNFDIDARAGDHSPWSNEEVVALLRIGSGMENWFPEATWKHVSRKLAELGFKRSAGKCKEKFEEQTRSFNNNNNINVNVNYSKNNYRVLVNELEEIYDHRHHHDHVPPPPPLEQQPLQEVAHCNDNVDDGHGNVEKSMEEEDKEGEEEEEVGRRGEEGEKMGQNNMELEVDSGAVEIDRKGVVEEEEDKVEKKRKRREKFGMFKRFCESVVERLMEQQVEMHNKLIEDMMRRDREMVEKEEAWKKLEMERVNKELDVRAQEQTISNNRQASIIEFLKRFRTSPPREGQEGDDSDQIPNPATRLVDKDNESEMPPATTTDDDRQNPSPPPPAIASPNPKPSSTARNPRLSNNTEGSDTGKRWPKEEVLALINLRCTIQGNNEADRDHQQQHPHGGGVKQAPLWERISHGMSELGYKRSAKRCKEKWENINKYFRKTKDSNASKKRSLDSRTCPYFHQLSTLYNQGKLPAAAPPENQPGSPENHPSSQETQ